MESTAATLNELPLHTIVIFATLLIALAAFIIMFLVPGLALNSQLRRCIKQLKDASASNTDSIAKIFATSETLKHLWSEFLDTLHEQTLPGANGVHQIVSYRQTVPAEMYFNEQILVHSPLKTEFFKHLPGILTGVGIIGTFTGLIMGLRDFHISDDPIKVRHSLDLLLHGVFQAFLVSAAAISLAMIITAIEKLLVTALYQTVEDLCLELDSKYDAGAGEEYLSKLVRSSEESATQARQLNQALVTDLKQILESLTERQIQAQSAHFNRLAGDITKSLVEGLKGPLDKIGGVVEVAAGDQTSAVNKLLTDTMSALIGQIRDLFSGQVDDIRGLQQRTIESLNTAVEQLNRLVGDISLRGSEASGAMAQQLANAVAAIERSQSVAAGQTQALVEAIRQNANSAQSEINGAVRSAIEQITTSIQGMSDSMHQHMNASQLKDGERGAAFVERTAQVAGTLEQLTKDLISQSSAAVAAMERSVASMQSATSDNIARMNAGAADMLKAANEFKSAGAATGTTLERAQLVATQLSAASDAVKNSSVALAQIASDHKSSRDAVGQMLEVVKATMEEAKREVALTSDIMTRIESSARALKDAQQHSEKYLEGISEVLSGAHQQFGTQIISTLNSVNGEFHKHVEKATVALAGAINQLDEVLDRVGSSDQ